MYSLKFDNKLNMYFVDYETKRVIKYLPSLKHKEKELTEKSIFDLLHKLEIKILPFDKVYTDFKIENGDKYVFGLSNTLPNSGMKFITVNPTSKHFNFVVLHELGHLILDHKNSELGRFYKELEANIVAFLVASSFYDLKTLMDMINYFYVYFLSMSEESCTRCIEAADKIIEQLK